MAECEKCRHSEAHVAALGAQVAWLREALKGLYEQVAQGQEGGFLPDTSPSLRASMVEAKAALALASEPPGGTP